MLTIWFSAAAAFALAVFPLSSFASPAATADTPPAAKPAAETSALQVPPKIAELCPVYPGAKVIDVVNAADVVRAMYKTPDEPVKIYEHYKKELSQRGWQLVHESFLDGARLVMKKDGEQFGFGAHQQRYEIVTFFISVIDAKNVSQPPAKNVPLKSPMRR
jgi:hypothetical protein